MSVTFTTLFERSKYSSLGRWFGLDEKARKHRMEQQERFAVGMIGFALEHDRLFRRHFLASVCGLKELSKVGGWEILVEPDNWGDLILQHKATRTFQVVEFKIGSALERHQNPSMPQFSLPGKNGRCAGYGLEMEQIRKRENWKRFRYVTIERRKSWHTARKQTPGHKWTSAEWRQFLRRDVTGESKIERDVYDCLARFGVGIFVAWRMNNMKLGANATKPLAILIGALEESTKSRAEFKPSLLDAGSEWLGINIRKKNKVVAWFGYEANPPKDSRLSLWLYKVDKPVKSSLPKPLRMAGTFQQNGSDIGVYCKAEDSTGDKEWFVNVLSALNQ